jgi:hypothetical protein
MGQYESIGFRTDPFLFALIPINHLEGKFYEYQVKINL